MSFKYFFFPLFLLSFYQGLSQSIISGKITDFEGNVLPYISVVLRNSADSLVIASSLSDDNGLYSFKISKSGSYKIHFNSLSYEELIKSINLSSFRQNLTIDVKLKFKAFELEEVIVNTKKQITIKNDTIIFDVKSFTTGEERVVEDILKKIPGLTVDSDGTVRVGSQEVEKIMVEGDDFFEKGYRILSKNMPSYPVSQIELLKNYSKNV
ncbi:carboxypeptidase-like regulatory domain-containing protein [Spirosoma pulveris]